MFSSKLSHYFIKYYNNLAYFLKSFNIFQDVHFCSDFLKRKEKEIEMLSSLKSQQRHHSKRTINQDSIEIENRKIIEIASNLLLMLECLACGS